MTFNESPPYSDSSDVSGIEETNIRIDMKIIAPRTGALRNLIQFRYRISSDSEGIGSDHPLSINDNFIL